MMRQDVRALTGGPTSCRELVKRALLERIGDGVLVPGTRIVEARLAEEFRVSAIPVREAIRELVSMGVLAAANNCGAWVREVSLAETVEALEVKAALEAQAASAAARRLKGKCDGLRSLARKLATAARKRDFGAYQALNHSFHRQIAEAGGNAILLRLWDSLAFEVRTRWILEFIRRENPVLIAREHDAIVAALDSGNAGRVARLLSAHAGRLVKQLRSAAVEAPDAGTSARRPSVPKAVRKTQ